MKSIQMTVRNIVLYGLVQVNNIKLLKYGGLTGPAERKGQRKDKTYRDKMETLWL